MDRVLTVNQKIFFTLALAAEEDLSRLSGADMPGYLLGQLSASVWAYPLKEGLRLVTKSFTATTRLIPLSSGGALLSFQEVEPTTPREVTTVFREGRKITAEWSMIGKDETAEGSEGALILWRTLRHEEEIDSPPLSDSPPESSGATAPPAAKEVKKPDNEEHILPQSEIDRLILTLKNRGIGLVEGKGDTEHAPPAEFPGKAGESVPPAAEPLEAPPLMDGIFSSIARENGVVSEGDLEESSERTPMAGIPRAQAESGAVETSWGFLDGIVPRPPFHLAETSQSLANLVEGRPYTVVVFKNRDVFERELALWQVKETDGTLLAFWAGESVFSRIGPRTRAHLEELRSAARGAAAFLQANKERIGALKQILPNLGEYRKKQGALGADAVETARKMKTIRLNQVMSIPEGRHLSRRIFAVEAEREALAKRLARATAGIFRRSTLSARFRFARLHSRFVLVQRELEAWMEKLSALEREVQRRLEYQVEWQELVKEQIKIQRELGEIARFIAMAEEVPADVTSNPEAVKGWLSSEEEALRRREAFLRLWADQLAEERSWIARIPAEPFLILGDEPLLALPGVTCGAHLVVVAEGEAGPLGLSGVFESCSNWVITDAAFQIIETGQGLGQMMEPEFVLAEELARRTGIDPGEALHTLGLLEAQKTDGHSMGVV